MAPSTRALVLALSVVSLSTACAGDDGSDAGDEIGGTGMDTGTETGTGTGTETGTGTGDTGGETTGGTDETCVSGTYWTMGNQESPLMHPGNDCLGCHQSMNQAPWVDMAGTVYTNEHEVDDCNGVPGVTVRITDSMGTEFETVTNSAGNFLFENVDIVPPYSAHLEWEGRVRDMVGMQTEASCNSCHSEQGDQNAPGRILAP